MDNSDISAMVPLDRRQFLGATGSAFAALLAAGCTLRESPASLTGAAPFYGPLQPDPNGILDLPRGFSYRIISKLGDAMDDGYTVPDRADGMGCFALKDGRIALVRNHELQAHHQPGGKLANGFDRLQQDNGKAGAVLPGGTTHIILDPASLKVERQFRSLAGTIRNCAGGITPWGSWLTCEEDVTRKDKGVARDHGWVFEVPANATGLITPEPLRAMGRFNHEAAAIDPLSGIVYMTEDRGDGLFYRFIPNQPGKLHQGGKLQALRLKSGLADSRNIQALNWSIGGWLEADWVDLDNVESPEDDLRQRGAANGACLFARGEGIHMGTGPDGASEIYFCCTSGGSIERGQIFRLRPDAGKGDKIQLFFETASAAEFSYGDNLTIAPNGHLIVCEDQYDDVVDNHLRGITGQGIAYPLARYRLQSELAGACFSPDGKTLFVNGYSPATTFAITGPWAT